MHNTILTRRRSPRAPWLAITLGLSACGLFADTNRVVNDLRQAQTELSQTLGVPVSIHFKAEDLESARHARVKLGRMPAGLTRVQIERNVNIVLHKYVPRVETIDVEIP